MRWRPENNKKRACNTETFGKDRQKETAAVRNKCTQVAICCTVSVCTAGNHMQTGQKHKVCIFILSLLKMEIYNWRLPVVLYRTMALLRKL